jgi:hypothetical protein
VILSAVTLLTMMMLAANTAGADQQHDQHWRRVMAGDRKVGHVEHTRRIEQGRVFETETLTLELGRTGRRVTYRVQLDTESSSDGALLRLVREAKTSEGHGLVDARVVGPDLTISIGAGDDRQTLTLAGVAGTLKSGEFARAWLRGTGDAPLRYRTFDPTRLAIADVELTRLPDSATRQVRRVVRVSGTESITLLSLDAAGNVADEALSLGGMKLRLLGATEQEARARDEVLDHVAGQLQKSPYRIPGRDMRAKIRYGFDHGGTPRQLPVGAGQRSWSDAQTTWIQVCASCPPDAAELTALERAQAVAATPWLNFGDEALSRRARRVAQGATEAAHKMRRLTQYVREHMTEQQIDMLGYGSAVEAYRSRRGDCTEYAVLLAAMGRAAGVPTRVVSGLVYARHFEGHRHVFVPHAWVQAWTGGAWQSFDAGLGHFDSTHLAFASSYDGNPAQLFAGINLAHELKLRSAAKVLPRPAAPAASD